MHPKIKEIRLISAMDNLINLYNEGTFDKNTYLNLKRLLDNRINGIDNNYEYDNITNNTKQTAIVAFSGGVDSTASTVIASKLFNIIGITAYSDIIMHPDNKKNISNLAKKLKIRHEFLDIDLNEVLKDTVNGKYHPCGRCHTTVESAVLNYALENNIKYIIYGDMLSVGQLSIIRNKNNIVRINMPSFLCLTKNESREILKKNNIVISQKYGCSLLKKSHAFNHNRKFTIQRILREVRAQVIDKEEGLNNILEVLDM
ncbi:7-cyano-7-deazaguanine synthase [Methanococcus aeolicus]|uniref:7-cyano-7-deazaguanine synthase n=1 Tax=Methanococcus aeolicus TaxID=42879 RepID=UPI0021C69FBE|nr:7-cyano-7-deazaguanine synthase [Methanococcus aeolicus]UXM85132.1 7-cyano-7-deazaguanine synthase [Methanococcus aeolicus]